jgi:hypothetical protein
MTVTEPVPITNNTYQFSLNHTITGCMECPFYVTVYDENIHYTHHTCKAFCPCKTFATEGMFYTHATERQLGEWFAACPVKVVRCLNER